jgi:hypothetical protein
MLSTPVGVHTLFNYDKSFAHEAATMLLNKRMILSSLIPSDFETHKLVLQETAVTRL